jgi:hypothetical protein
MEILLLAALFVAVPIAAVRHGAETRPEFRGRADWRGRRD